MKSKIFTFLFLTSVVLISCNNQKPAEPTTLASEKNIKDSTINYQLDSISFKSFVSYDANKEGKRPGILVVPEWWGLNDYAKTRAKQLADMGYIALAVDMYGNGKTAENPKDAQALATPFYMDPTLTKTRLDAALKQLKSYSQTDTNNIAAIGYCYGGFVVLNAAKLGADLKGVVSFHGNLSGVTPTKALLKAKVLVCHGEADKFVSSDEVAKFKKVMDSVGASYTFKSYPNATHAFTNPASTENGKKFNLPIAYNAAADSASWNDMKVFFGEVFGKK